MAPSRNTVLALLGLLTSIQAIPAALPEAQFSIGPPHYSISWDAPLPVTTDDPEDPEAPEYPVPTPSDQISLGQPSATISWDGPSVPTEDPEPEDPEDPEEPEEPLPSPTDVITLNPPSYSISWDGPKPPKTTKKPWPPRPTAKTSTNGHVSASVSWGKREDSPSYFVSWDPQPPATTRKPWPWWPPAWTSTNGYVSASVSWDKRQEDEDPEPTDFPGFPDDPEEPENPENPISFPAGPLPTPPNSIGIQPPQVSFSWGKRQEEEPEPTEFPDPEDPEDPEDPDSPISFPGAPAPTPPNSIGIQPPRVSFSWGKREHDATAPSYGLGKPTASIKPPKPSKSSRHPKTTTKAWVSWGKRQEDDGPTEVFPPAPTPSDQITFVPPTASLSWGKRDAEAQLPTYGLGFPSFSFGLPPVAPSSAHISWGKRDDDKKHPTTLLTHTTLPTLTVTDYIPTSTPSACPTVTKTVVPPCVPPTCPHNLVSCKVGEAQEMGVREIEKTIVTITTVGKPSLKPTATKSVCTTSTVVVDVGCPTYTCVPRGDCN
ncbi:hypothetical protein P171DRAFT_435466 [Karstenula rhodostoma CBS 690.94]|uniref:Uncharacterized protein n=1 Tax=Karstenula rhodostoma CBS 690.94 TaxID=1392251 RepID=A0A9P4U8B1_9PLEO|nr:hypothetical protein P171DRAFT_435466 [Karstenula rhodostoma CBS 690.94]